MDPRRYKAPPIYIDETSPPHDPFPTTSLVAFLFLPVLLRHRHRGHRHWCTDAAPRSYALRLRGCACSRSQNLLVLSSAITSGTCAPSSHRRRARLPELTHARSDLSTFFGCSSHCQSGQTCSQAARAPGLHRRPVAAAWVARRARRLSLGWAGSSHKARACP